VPAPSAEGEPRPEDALASARVQLAAGRPDAAIVALEAALVDAAPGRELWALLGDAYVLTGRTRDAVTAYGRAVALAGAADPGALVVDLGDAMLAEGDRTRARALWSSHLERFPAGPTASTVASRLAALSAQLGEDATAERLWRFVLDRTPDAPASATALTELGRRLLARHAWADATALFAPFADGTRGHLAEIALVGAMHARAGEARWDLVRELVARYRRAFPDGPRAAEVDVLAAAAEGHGAR
jgi:tetratricopeptide (TPR) repeat protein